MAEAGLYVLTGGKEPNVAKPLVGDDPMNQNIDARLQELFPAASVPDYKGRGADMVAGWVLLNDAPIFDEVKEGLPQMAATKDEFYTDIREMFAGIKDHQRKT